jgi:HD-like signal output (HDOD) protein/CheY-like chemotaxis protein
MKPRILFADDEPNVLEGLGRMLRDMRESWDMRFVTSVEQALNEMKFEPFDVVVSDMGMPGLNGLQLLTEVRDKYPSTIRLILSGHPDEQCILQSIGVTHQYLSKPCKAEELKKILKRAVNLRNLAANEKVKQLLSQIDKLPSLPTLYFEIVRELQSDDASIKKIGKIISKDMSMTAKILQVANSAFFGLRRRILNADDAVVYLGLETIQTLVLSIHVFSQFTSMRVAGLSLEQMWSHSMATGVLAKTIAQTGMLGKEIADEAFTAGLLHDLGRLVLALNLPLEYCEAMASSQQNEILLCEAEQRIFDTTHAEVGAYLLALWGLPDTILESIAYHHRPTEFPTDDFCILSAVHIADSLVSEVHSGEEKELVTSVDIDYLTRIGVATRMETWRECCQHLRIGAESR